MLLTASVLYPFFVCWPPPLGDYPNHLARVYIISNIQHSANLQRYYEVDWRLIPNLAVDIVVPVLSQIMSVEVAMVVFTALALMLTCTGVWAVHRALFQRVSVVPLAVFLVLYNRQFLGGFVNYIFGLGLALWAFAAFVWFRHPLTIGRGILLTCAFAAVLVCHLVAFAILGVLVCGYEMARLLSEPREHLWKSLRQSIAVALPLAAPLILFFIFSPTRELSVILSPSPLVQRSSDVLYGTLSQRLVGMLDAFLNYNTFLDVVTFLLFIAAFALPLWLGIIRVHRSVVGSIVVLILLYWTLPFQIIGTFGVNRRLAPVIFMVLIAGVDLIAPKPKLQHFLVAAVAALVLVRMAVVVVNWHAANEVYANILSAIELMPEGARMAGAVASPPRPFLGNPPVRHMTNMAVVKRRALVNSLFADPGRQPLRYRIIPADVKAMRLPHESNAEDSGGGRPVSKRNPYTSVPRNDYDYLLVINSQYFPYEPDAGFTKLYENRNVILWRIKH